MGTLRISTSNPQEPCKDPQGPGNGTPGTLTRSLRILTNNKDPSGGSCSCRGLLFPLLPPEAKEIADVCTQAYYSDKGLPFG